MANVFDVARYILNETGEVSTMKLQKLCYYSFVKHMQDYGVKLFDGHFEAWANGPVNRALFKVHKGLFVCNERTFPAKLCNEKITREEQKSINYVLDKYGALSGAELSEKTHGEAPWINARGDMPTYLRCTKQIKLSDIESFYEANPI